jgi:hypothetical protein
MRHLVLLSLDVIIKLLIDNFLFGISYYRARRLLLRGADPTSIIQQCSLAGCRLKESLQVSLHKSPQLMVQVGRAHVCSFIFVPHCESLLPLDSTHWG